MDWWAILGYFGVIVGGLGVPVVLIVRVLHNREAASGEQMPSAFVTGIFAVLAGAFWFAVGVWAFGKSQYALSDQTDETITLLMVGVAVVTVVIGLIILAVKVAISKKGSFWQKVAVSSAAGVISSAISYFAGFGGGIDIVSLSIGGVVFLTVSVLSA